jgi:hypothetical protein
LTYRAWGRNLITLDLQCLSNDLNDGLIFSICDNCPQLKHLLLSSVGHSKKVTYTDTALRKISGAYNLTSLYLPVSVGVSEAALKELALSQNELTGLGFKATRPLGSIQLSCKLQKLVWNAPMSVQWAIQQSVQDVFSCLTHLELNGLGLLPMDIAQIIRPKGALEVSTIPKLVHLWIEFPNTMKHSLDPILDCLFPEATSNHHKKAVVSKHRLRYLLILAHGSSVSPQILNQLFRHDTARMLTYLALMCLPSNGSNLVAIEEALAGIDTVATPFNLRYIRIPPGPGSKEKHDMNTILGKLYFLEEFYHINGFGVYDRVRFQRLEEMSPLGRSGAKFQKDLAQEIR